MPGAWRRRRERQIQELVRLYRNDMMPEVMSGKSKVRREARPGWLGTGARVVASPVAPGHVTTRPLEYGPVCWLAGRAQCSWQRDYTAVQLPSRPQDAYK